MGDRRYMISDASKKVNVEAHVLRYWEEELELTIPRNEMGHRYYTEEHIQLFKQVKELKENGYQLKAIKMILPKLTDMDEDEFSFLTVLSEEMNRRAMADEEQPEEESATPSNVIPLNRNDARVSKEDKMEQFQLLMNEILSRAILENSENLGSHIGAAIGEQISEKVLKEMDYLMRLKEEREEEHFKRFDETLRQYQKGNVEAAATSMSGREPRKKRNYFFRRNK
ncbi:MAG: helix-turn-helix domain-containing protein [Lachnospiraceae bacterium]